MRLFLIRHGETPWTISGQHTGRSNPPLTERGKKEARLLGEKLKNYQFEKILCSSSSRAMDTCKIAGFFDQAEVTHQLSEWDYGKYEGLTTSEIHLQDPEWNIFSKGAPDGESISDIEKRVREVYALIEGLRGDAALFSSGHFLRAFAAFWLQFPLTAGKSFALSPGSISILGFERITPVVLLWNNFMISS